MSTFQKEVKICGWSSDRLSSYTDFEDKIKKCAVGYTGADVLSVKQIQPPPEITEEFNQLIDGVLSSYLKCFTKSAELHIIVRKALSDLASTAISSISSISHVSKSDEYKPEFLEEKQIDQLIDAISTELDRMKLQNETFFKLILAESFTNHLSHGNRYDPRKVISVSYGMNCDGDFEVISSDQGEGFDHDNIPDPRSEERIHEEGGRGVFLIRQLSDKVEYRDGGRTLHIVINLANKIKEPLSRALKNLE